MKSAALLAAFDLEHRRMVHLIGGGGKTTLLGGMARALAGLGKRVAVTTSTRILTSEGVKIGAVRIGERGDIERGSPVVLVRAESGEKLLGYSAEEIDAFAELADVVLVEADGSAGRPLKAHAEWEPVIASSADLVVAVVGAWCLGEPLDDDAVHRAELFASRVGCALGTALEVRHVVEILFHEKGYLAKVPPRADVMLAVTSRSSDDGGLALGIAQAQAGRVMRVVSILGTEDARVVCPAK